MTRDQGADCLDARVKIGTANCSYCSWSDPMKLLVKVAWETQFIGILNTFGFDHVEIESFRQLCINSAKEKFQQSWKPLRSNTTNTAFRGRISTSKTIQMSSIWMKVTELFEWGIDAGNLLRRGISEKSGCCDGEQSASGLYAWITGHSQSVITRAKSLTTREAFWISIAMRFCLKLEALLAKASILSRMFVIDANETKKPTALLSYRQKAQAQPRQTIEALSSEWVWRN